ncbi:Slp family lipoprotein [Aliidiomarina quisquiliarum]|uniref:Slp family lipoprotein n=1 Tax=Aliidiomarina quisquiliarum TaxID=2938947 RepID=UPI00208E407A|nr:Slp family lipoprotein [Aliidiomarina quisquiliarum]MCO4320183.1 Slp family lipoprotein [Aliidiomarina quisquiliarum]
MMFSIQIKYILRLFFVLGAAIALSACAARYPEAIRGDDSALVSYQQTINSPDAGVGSSARWGGIIANVNNLETMSVIEVVTMELRGTGRPIADENSLGRFRVQVNGFIDPEVYAPGRLVTVFGTYVGKETDKIGEFIYHFPLLQSQGVHLWRMDDQNPRVDVMFHYGFGHPYYRYPYYGPAYYYPGWGQSPPPAASDKLKPGPRVQGTRGSRSSDEQG